MSDEEIEELALAMRQALAPGSSPLEAVPLERLVAPCTIPTSDGTVSAQVRKAPMGLHVWGITTFGGTGAWIWLNADAWPELPKGVARTRFTVAHELGHVALHADELEGLDERPESEHSQALERQANTFAARLLIPNAALKRLSLRGGTAAEILAKRFGVSTLAAQRRLEEWRG